MWICIYFSVCNLETLIVFLLFFLSIFFGLLGFLELFEVD